MSHSSQKLDVNLLYLSGIVILMEIPVISVRFTKSEMLLNEGTGIQFYKQKKCGSQRLKIQEIMTFMQIISF